MKKWKRFLTGVLAAVTLTVCLPYQAEAANAWLDQAKDDNAQHLLILEQQDPENYLYLITLDPAERQSIYIAAQVIVTGCETDAEKTEAIYKWVTANIYYDWDGLESGALAPVDPYSVLINHYAVCEGYATLLAELLNSVGIPCVTFHGASCSQNPGATRDDDSVWSELEYNDIDHAWNAAYVDGEWRYYDATWDSQNSYYQGQFLDGRRTMDYYAVEPEEFGAGHRSAYRINDSGGFRLENGTWVRYNEDGGLTSGVVLDFYNGLVYAYQDGFPVSGRVIVEFQLAEFSDAGQYLRNCTDYNGWFYQGGDWYYLSGGITCYGWGYINGHWYYLDPTTCKMATGWRWIGGKWYYFAGSGEMATGWLLDGGKWYYLDGSGAMKTGWIYVGNKWYYLDGSGAMKTGWVWTGGHWYYLYADGSMASNTVIDGYRLNAQGTY